MANVKPMGMSVRGHPETLKKIRQLMQFRQNPIIDPVGNYQLATSLHS